MTSSDPRLEDDTALEEINLYADLVIAASESEQRLSQQEIDRLLGVRREPPVTPRQG
ncbi:MAG TPA: hypothetical protein VKP64_15350 [Mycobacteriales bacterium]|nr:hypothetical protein [Mycobacteriales bacterium]